MRLLSFYLNLSFKNKLLVSYFATIAAAVLMVSALIFAAGTAAVEGQARFYARKLVEQAGQNIESRLLAIDNELVFSYINNPRLNRPLMREGGDALSGAAGSHQAVMDLVYARTYIRSVCLVDPAGNRFMAHKPDVQTPVTGRLSAAERGLLRQLHGRGLWLAGTTGTLRNQRALYDTERLNHIGYLEIGIDSRAVSDLHAEHESASRGVLLALDYEKKPFLYSDEEGRRLAESFVAVQAGESAGSALIRHAGRSYIPFSLLTPELELTVLYLASMEPVEASYRSLLYWTLCAAGLAGLLAFVLMSLVSRHFSASLNQILASVRTVAAGDFSRRIEPGGRDEIGQLAGEFNHMSERVRELMERVLREKKLRERARYRLLVSRYNALQAQLNPHFLYNVLDSISSIAKLGGNQRIDRLVQHVAGVLRENLRARGQLASLRSELAYIKNYLAIYQEIYGDKLELRWEIEPRVLAARVPVFILLPLVENAIRHGIEAKVGRGTIAIHAVAGESRLTITVADNGMGMDEAAIRKVLDGRPVSVEASAPHTRLGLHNVVKRLELLFNEKDCLSIQSIPGQGATVSLSMPLILKGRGYLDVVQSRGR